MAIAVQVRVYLTGLPVQLNYKDKPERVLYNCICSSGLPDGYNCTGDPVRYTLPSSLTERVTDRIRLVGLRLKFEFDVFHKQFF